MIMWCWFVFAETEVTTEAATTAAIASSHDTAYEEACLFKKKAQQQIFI